MAKYTNISGDVTNQILIRKGNVVEDYRVNKLTIINTHDSATQTTSLNIYDGTNTYVLYNKIDIPPKTVLVLTDNLFFDPTTYSLRLTTSGSSSSTVIIN